MLMVPWLGLIPLGYFFRSTRDDLLSYRQSMVNTQLVVTSHTGEIRSIYDKLDEQGRAIQAIQAAIEGHLVAQRPLPPASGAAFGSPPPAPTTASSTTPPVTAPTQALKPEVLPQPAPREPMPLGRGGGNAAVQAKRPEGPIALDGGGHRVVKGESLWRIAKYEAIYNDPSYWPLLYWDNRQQVKDPDLIFPGQELRIPRNISQGTLREATRAAHSAKQVKEP